MADILIGSGVQLATNPRVVKEADALASAGHRVTVAAARFESALAGREAAFMTGQKWHYVPLVDAFGGRIERLRWQGMRLGRRLALEAGRRFGWEMARQLSYTGHALLRYARRHRADLTIMHNPGGLWAGVRLLGRGHRVAFDVEDWYSEDLLPEARQGQPYQRLKEWERTALQAGCYVTTTSEALADGLAAAYGCPRPQVVYNVFPWTERETLDGEVLDRRDLTLPSVMWFSQVIGPGRGLEGLAAALHHVQYPFELHLRGRVEAAYEQALRAQIPAAWQRRVFFHAQVPHDALLSRIAEHDIGLACEIPYCENKRLTISNKLFQYLLGGLAVVASETPGQREASRLAPGAVHLYPAEEPGALAAALDRLTSDPAALREAQASALAAARARLHWEAVTPRLLDVVNEVLAAPPPLPL
jgi:glycosyltransferase involved in cell wall biosynthesis